MGKVNVIPELAHYLQLPLNVQVVLRLRGALLYPDLPTVVGSGMFLVTAAPLVIWCIYALMKVFWKLWARGSCSCSFATLPLEPPLLVYSSVSASVSALRFSSQG